MRIVANVHPDLLGIRMLYGASMWVEGATSTVVEELNQLREMTFITSVVV